MRKLERKVEYIRELEEQRRILLKEFLTPEAKERSILIINNIIYLS